MSSAMLGSRVTEFFAWWGHELAELMPGASGSASEPQAARTVIGIEPQGLRLIESSGPKSEVRPEGIVPAAAMLAYLSSRSRNRTVPGGIALRIPVSSCFVRRVELPAAARGDFSRLLSMDLERTTPFKHKDVLTAYDIDTAPAAKGMVRVRQLIVKRRVIDALKADFEALGLKVKRIDCSDADGGVIPVNFLEPVVATSPGSNRKGSLALALGLVLAGLAGSALYLYEERHEQALAGLQADSAKLRVKAQVQKDALAKSQAAFAELANYKKLRAETVSKVQILEELTRILPDTAWVTDLKIEGSTVDISGLAQSAAAIVPILERSKVFVDATSTASLTLDPREDKERFSIRARLRTSALGVAQASAEVVQ